MTNISFLAAKLFLLVTLATQITATFRADYARQYTDMMNWFTSVFANTPPPTPTPAFPALKIIVQSFSALVLHILVGFYHITQYINTLNFQDQADNDMIKCNIQNKKLFTSPEGLSMEDCSRASSARLLPAGPKKPTVNLPLFSFC